MRDVYEMIGLLRKALAKQKYTQRDVAKWLGLTESAVSILFSGMRNMKADKSNFQQKKEAFLIKWKTPLFVDLS